MSAACGSSSRARLRDGLRVLSASLVFAFTTAGQAAAGQSPTPSQTSQHTSAATAEPRAIATRLFDAFNRHDVDSLVALYADDAVLLSPDHPAALRGTRGVRDTYAPLFVMFPDLHDRIVSITGEGERVAIEFVSTGCSAAGQCFELPIASVLTVRDGRIVRDASYFDVQGQRAVCAKSTGDRRHARAAHASRNGRRRRQQRDL